MGKCINCKYYREGTCTVPMWAECRFYPGIATKEGNGCWLFDSGFVQEEEEQKQ